VRPWSPWRWLCSFATALFVVAVSIERSDHHHSESGGAGHVESSEGVEHAEGEEAVVGIAVIMYAPR